MAIDFANTLAKRLVYPNVQQALLGQTIAWVHFRVLVNAWHTGEDQYIFALEQSGGGFAPGIYCYLDYLGAGSRDNCMRFYMADATPSGCNRYSADESFATTDVWQTYLVKVVLTPGSSTAAITAYRNGSLVTGAQSGTTHVALNGGFNLTGTDLSLGGIVGSAPGDFKLEDFVLCVGAEPTTQEITDLQTKSPSVALAGSDSTIVFYPDLTRYDLRDRVSLSTPTISTRPIRSLVPGVDYGRGPTMPILGDPQFWGAMAGDLWGDFASWVDDYNAGLNFDQIACVGDWVDDDQSTDDVELLAARAGVDAVMLTGVQIFGPPGNHDISTDVAPAPDDYRGCVKLSDDAHLPPLLFYGQDDFGAAISHEGRSVGTDSYCYYWFWRDMVWFSVPFGETLAQRDFVVASAALFPTKRVGVIAHAWLNSAGDVYDDSHPSAGQDDQYRPAAYLQSDFEPSIDPGGTVAASGLDGSWETHWKRIPNLSVICCGHDIRNIATQKTAQRLLTGQAGNSVLAIFVNNQNPTDGGKGLMTLLEFDGDDVHAESYFALTNEFYDGSGNSFDYEIVSGRSRVLPGLRLDLSLAI